MGSPYAREGLISRAVTPVFVTLAVLILWPVFQDAWTRLRHDDSPPIVLHSSVLETPVVSAGGVLRYSAVYSKRSDCYPPDGKGEVSYRLTRLEDESSEHKFMSYVFDFRREARWPPGVNANYRTSVPIPSDIPPGRYIYTVTSAFECKGASKVLMVEGPVLTLTITR